MARPIQRRGEQTLHDLVDASGVRRDGLPRSPATMVLMDEPLHSGGGKLSMRLTDHGEEHVHPGRHRGQHAGRQPRCQSLRHLLARETARAGEPSPTHSQARCLSHRRDIAVPQGLQGGTRGEMRPTHPLRHLQPMRRCRWVGQRSAAHARRPTAQHGRAAGQQS
jgi:hypothetical protein